MAYVKVRLENKEGIHNKFYEMLLTSDMDLNPKVRIEIHSGRIGVTNIRQQPAETQNGWSTWGDGYDWFTKQLKRKVGPQKEYDLRTIEASGNNIENDVQQIADKFGSERKKVERFETFLQTHWW